MLELARLRDERALGPLLAEVWREDKDEKRRKVAEAMGDLGDAAAVPVLGKMLKDCAVWNRQAAAEALEKLGRKNPLGRQIFAGEEWRWREWLAEGWRRR